MTRLIPPFPFVCVSWDDAHGNAGTAFSLHEIPHASVQIDTYGFLLREDEKGVSVVNEVCHDGTYRGYTYVPRALIIAVEHVAGPAKPRGRKSRAAGGEGHGAVPVPVPPV